MTLPARDCELLQKTVDLEACKKNDCIDFIEVIEERV